MDRRLDSLWLGCVTCQVVEDLQRREIENLRGKPSAWNTATESQQADRIPNAPSMANDGNKAIKTFVAGDVRASEHPVLSSFHTLFVREHNRICDILIARGQRDDERNYEAARKIVGALIRTLHSKNFCRHLELRCKPYRGYNGRAKLQP